MSSLAKVLLRYANTWSVVMVLLILLEIALSVIIVKKVSYTEIDWKAYMDEVQPVIENNERNYSHLRGETGPLVYPAGFVWLYSWLWSVTSGGEDILRAQYIHIGIYVALLVLVGLIYKKDQKFTPAALLFLLVASKRIHSIFMLRMFNDCTTMLFIYLSVLLFANRKPFLGVAAWTLALSIKMNALLLLPAILLILVVHKGWLRAFLYLILAGAAQVLIGYPFIAFDLNAYVSASFNFSRVFKQKWSVNFKWVPCTPLPLEEETLLEDCVGLFSSKEFGLMMLGGHLTVLAIFAWFWVQKAGGVKKLLTSTCTPYQSADIIKILFITNFVGIAFARSLHFQFYVWYFHTILYLVVGIRCLPSVLKPLLVLGIEFSWNPWKGDSSTYESSLLLTACHIVMLLCLLFDAATEPVGIPDKKHR